MENRNDEASKRKAEDDTIKQAAKKTAITDFFARKDIESSKRKAEDNTIKQAQEARKKRAAAYHKQYEKNRDREFIEKWSRTRDWLTDTSDGMKCSVCIDFAKKAPPKRVNMFLTGCSSYKTESISIHEKR